MFHRRDDEEFEYFKERAIFCMLTRQTPDYYDSLTQKEIRAWWSAYKEINK